MHDSYMPELHACNKYCVCYGSSVAAGAGRCPDRPVTVRPQLPLGPRMAHVETPPRKL